MRYFTVIGMGKSIVLIGMMGAGKSSVGRCLHRRTGLALLDIDEVVASKFQMSIPKIFAEHGEKKFREAETEALRRVQTEEQKIIVTGGGVVLGKENVEILRKQGVIVWLDGDEDTLFARASQKQNRPLLQTKNPRKDFSQILRARRSLYADMVDVRIDTSVLTDEEVAVAILAKVRRINPKRESAISAKAT
ncbi:MAG TPA: shikimate kinase [Candidatus Udaeobacter sp.]